MAVNPTAYEIYEKAIATYKTDGKVINLQNRCQGYQPTKQMSRLSTYKTDVKVNNLQNRCQG